MSQANRDSYQPWSEAMATAFRADVEGKADRFGLTDSRTLDSTYNIAQTLRDDPNSPMATWISSKPNFQNIVPRTVHFFDRGWPVNTATNQQRNDAFIGQSIGQIRRPCAQCQRLCQINPEDPPRFEDCVTVKLEGGAAPIFHSGDCMNCYVRNERCSYNGNSDDVTEPWALTGHGVPASLSATVTTVTTDGPQDNAGRTQQPLRPSVPETTSSTRRRPRSLTPTPAGRSGSDQPRQDRGRTRRRLNHDGPDGSRRGRSNDQSVTRQTTDQAVSNIGPPPGTVPDTINVSSTITHLWATDLDRTLSTAMVDTSELGTLLLPRPQYRNWVTNPTPLHIALYDLSIHDDDQAYRGISVPPRIRQNLVDALNGIDAGQRADALRDAIRDLAVAASNNREDPTPWLRWGRGVMLSITLHSTPLDPSLHQLYTLLQEFRAGFGYDRAARIEDLQGQYLQFTYGDLATILYDGLGHEGWMNDTLLHRCLTAHVVNDWITRTNQSRSEITKCPYVLKWSDFKNYDQRRDSQGRRDARLLKVPPGHTGDIYLITNISNFHWCLTAIMRANRKIIVLDSIRHDGHIEQGRRYAREILCGLDEDPSQWTDVTGESAQSQVQRDGWNCGTFMLENAKSLMTTGGPARTAVNLGSRVYWLRTLLDIVRKTRQSGRIGWNDRPESNDHAGLGIRARTPDLLGSGRGKDDPLRIDL